MEKPYRTRRKALKIGHSKYLILPFFWKHAVKDEFVLEIFKDRIVITPGK